MKHIIIAIVAIFSLLVSTAPNGTLSGAPAAIAPTHIASPDRGHFRSGDHQSKKLPVFYEDRSTPDQPAFVANRISHQVLMEDTGMTIFLSSSSGAGSVVRTQFEGAEAEALPTGEGALPTKVYRIKSQQPGGSPVRGFAFSQVRYRELYRGIDLVFGADDRAVSYTIEVAADASADAIRWRYDGYDDISIDSTGALTVKTPAGSLQWSRPKAYWLDGKVRREVAVNYVLDEGVVSFDVGNYPAGHALIIDPVLTVVTYFGGSGNDNIFGSSSQTVAKNGDLVLALATTSLNLAGTTGAFAETAPGGGSMDIFVLRLNPTADTVLFATYLGSPGIEFANSLALTSTEEPVMIATTSSASFPTTAGAHRTTGPSGASDAVVVILAADGSALTGSTYLGGSAGDGGTGVVVLPNDTILCVGVTVTPGGFPVTAGAAQSSYGGGPSDMFVAVLNRSAALLYASYLGGSGDDLAPASRVIAGGDGFFGPHVTVDASGNVVIAGVTGSSDFPTSPGVYSRTFQGVEDGFIAYLDGSNFSVLRSTLMGGSKFEAIVGVTVDDQGRVVVTGDTTSTDFPIVGAGPQTSFNGGVADAFAARLSSDLATLEFSTYVGGNASDQSGGRVMTAGSLIQMAGFTSSTNLPATPDATQSLKAAALDAFLTIIDPQSSTFQFMTYLGGNSDDAAISLSRDPWGNLFIAGTTVSSNLAPSPGVVQPTYGGGLTDAFVVKYQTIVPAALSAYTAGAWFTDINRDYGFDPATDVTGWGSPADLPVIGDWNGDGFDELGVYSGGTWFLDVNGDRAFDPATEVFGWGAPGWIPVVGDWNGDGITDLGVVDPSTSTWFRDVNGDLAFDAATEIQGWGSPGDTPVVGDWNGSGSDSIGVFSGGTWFLDFTGNGAFDPATDIRGWGVAGWTPVVGDWDGDGATEIGAVRPDLTWFRDVNGDFGFDPAKEVLGWGSAGNTPLVADWNGDGIDDVGAFAGGTWFIDANGDGAFQAATEIRGWGVAGWTPVPGRWR